MRSESFSLKVRRSDQRGPFLDLTLDKFLEISGRPALGRNQNGAELLKGAPRSREGDGPRAWREYYTLSAGSELGSPQIAPTKKQRPVSKGGRDMIRRECSIACADAGGLDYRTPLVDFRLKQRSEPFRCRAFDNNAEWLEPGPHRGFG